MMNIVKKMWDQFFVIKELIFTMPKNILDSKEEGNGKKINNADNER